jgi:hypothetical protein
MESNNRDFKGVWIPKVIWLAPDLSIIEKCLLVEIDSLDNDPAKGCFASNAFLGKFIGVSEGRCANIISSLKKRGFIYQVFFDGRNRGLRLYRGFKDEHSFHESVNSDCSNSLERTSRKREHSNTVSNSSKNTKSKGEPSSDSLNNISFSKGKKSKEEGSPGAAGHHEPETVDPQKFIEAFNAIENRKFRLNDQVRKALKERLKDYTKKEIFQAIKNAHKDKYHIEEGFIHLTPEFMLRPDKLEKFLNVLPSGKTNTRSIEGGPFRIGQKYNANG